MAVAEVDTTQVVEDAKTTLVVLSEHGWRQGTWGDCEYGFCLGGAMAFAISEGSTHVPSFMGPHQLARFNALTEALNLPVDTDDENPIDWVIGYNDGIAEILDDVKDVLNGAIARLTQGES